MDWDLAAWQCRQPVMTATNNTHTHYSHTLDAKVITTRCHGTCWQRVDRNSVRVSLHMQWKEKTNHFTFILIEAVAFALAVHYSFLVVGVFFPTPRSLYAARRFAHSCRLLCCEYQKKQIISLDEYNVNGVYVVRQCAAKPSLRVESGSLFSERYRYYFRGFFFEANSFYFISFSWWSLFRTVDTRSVDCIEIIYVFTLKLAEFTAQARARV